MHGRNDFGLGSESTSHIESVWSQIKSLITKLYYALKPENFIYFVRELEFSYNINNMNRRDKIKAIQDILYYNVVTSNFNFYDKEFLIDIDKENYTDESDNDSDNSN